MRQHTPEMDPASDAHQAFAEAVQQPGATVKMTGKDPKAVGCEGETRIPDEVVQVDVNVSLANKAMKVHAAKAGVEGYIPLFVALEEILMNFLKDNGEDPTFYKSVRETKEGMARKEAGNG